MILRNLTICLVIISLLEGCKTEIPDYYTLTGFTQVTTYRIRYDSGCRIKTKDMSQAVENLLRDFDFSLSTYNDSSLISSLNRGMEVEADTMMLAVFHKAYEINLMTEGAFDITAGPLINAWGFGPDAINSYRPEMLDSLMQLVGMNRLKLKGNRVIKEKREMYIDVNAIAQGYSVDMVCSFLHSRGVARCLVEIGGEIRTVGSKYPGKPWRVAIDKPVDNNFIPGAEVQAIVNLENKSLATSGNYRKFWVDENTGIKYSHTIDPVLGVPVRHNLLSATVISDDCMTADAFATACMVKGLEGAIELLQKYTFLEGYLVYSDENGEYRTWYTDNMIRYLSE